MLMIMLEFVADKLNLGHSRLLPGRMPIGLLAIIVANLSLLFLFVALDLSLYELMAVYWWETLWIGLFCVLKLLVASVFGSAFESRLVHVSAGAGVIFTIAAVGLVGGQFLGFFFLIGFFISFIFHVMTGLDPAELWMNGFASIFTASLVFLVGHGLSFVSNFLLGGEYKKASAVSLLSLPFKRCLAIFAAVGLAFLGAVIIPGFSNSIGFGALLVPIKLGFDYFSHLVERRSFQELPQ